MIATRKKHIVSYNPLGVPKAPGLEQALPVKRCYATSRSPGPNWLASPPADPPRSANRKTSRTLPVAATDHAPICHSFSRRITQTISDPSAYRARPDALSLYMREVAEVALLTREEETALARRIQAGDDQAREHMIRANLRLVVKIAREYENLGVPLLDLINEGNIGLIKAVDRFDPGRGVKLSTYGSWWIKQQIRRALADQGKTIRIPVNAVDQIYHLRKAGAKLEEILGREASDAELADELGLSLQRVAELRGAGIRPASLDAPLGDEHSSSLADVVADENAVNPAQRIDEKHAMGRLLDLVALLPEREAKIIRSRFGLDDGQERTLETIGARFGVTRERIRQLQKAALAKLRQMLEQPEARAAA